MKAKNLSACWTRIVFVTIFFNLTLALFCAPSLAGTVSPTYSYSTPQRGSVLEHDLWKCSGSACLSIAKAYVPVVTAYTTAAAVAALSAMPVAPDYTCLSTDPCWLDHYSLPLSRCSLIPSATAYTGYVDIDPNTGSNLTMGWLCFNGSYSGQVYPDNLVGFWSGFYYSETWVCDTGSTLVGHVCIKANCPANYKLSGNYPNWICTSQDIFTITLSGGNTTEPWNKKHDASHLQANLPFLAIVKDQNGQAKPGVNVSISSDVTPDTGGHIHNDGRPKGKLVPNPTGAGLSTGAASISGQTDGSGQFPFTFGAEEASGEHTLTATCSGCSNTSTAPVNVLIPGLTLLGVDPANYDLQGYKDWHPGDHYFSEAAVVKIINLAHAYRLAPDFNHQLLIINDSSLVKGGVLDLGQDWTYEDNGHQGHRKGIVVDINNFRDVPSPRFVRLAKDCCKIKANWEGSDVSATPHYHLLLLGPGRDE